MLTLYHCTSEAAARQILAEGFSDKTGRYLTHREWAGVWLSDRPLHNTEGASGDTVLQIEIAEEVIAPYEWVKEGKTFREWLAPPCNMNATGGTLFFKSYTPQLGNSTFRLVHGSDIVPTVPPSLMGQFRHVGRAIQCPTDGVFDAQTPILAPEENKPDFVESALQSGLADIRALASFRIIRRIGPRPLDRLAGLLPRMVRDHVPANYFRALSISLR